MWTVTWKDNEYPLQQDFGDNQAEKAKQMIDSLLLVSTFTDIKLIDPNGSVMLCSTAKEVTKFCVWVYFNENGKVYPYESVEALKGGTEVLVAPGGQLAIATVHHTDREKKTRKQMIELCEGRTPSKILKVVRDLKGDAA